MSYFCTSQSNATTAVIGQFPAISQPNQIWLWPRQMRESDRAFDSRKLSRDVRSRQTEYSPCQLSGFKEHTEKIFNMDSSNNNNNVQQPFGRNQQQLIKAILVSHMPISSLEPDSQVHQDYKYSQNGRLIQQCTEQGGLYRPVVGWETLVVSAEE